MSDNAPHAPQRALTADGRRTKPIEDAHSVRGVQLIHVISLIAGAVAAAVWLRRQRAERRSAEYANGYLDAAAALIGGNVVKRPHGD